MIQLMITAAGLDALVNAQSGQTDPIRVTEIAITETHFTPAPTLAALPNELKRIATFSGASIAPNVIHMTAQDSDAVAYDIRGIGLFLDDGTLFAVYSQATPLVVKVDIAAFLVSFDIAFADQVDDAIEFGDATFLYPPATESVKGVAEIATQPEVDAELDDERFVTPLKLGQRLAAFFDSVNQTIADLTQQVNDTLAAFAARTITGSGLVSGGGDLTADRVLEVLPASGADIAAGTEAGKAVTPAAIAQVPQTFGSSSSIRGLGGSIIKTGTLSVAWPGGGSHTFPVAFPTACNRVVMQPLGNPNQGDSDDEPCWVSSMSRTGFSVGVEGDARTTTFAYIAIGH